MFSIQEFFADAARSVRQHADFEAACARDIAALNEDPASRIAEASIYTSMLSAGVPGETVSSIRKRWEAQFDRFRDLSKASPVRTPALKIFRLCAQSVAARFGHSLERVLAREWVGFAVAPDERPRFEALLGRMERLRIEESWLKALDSTWEFLLAPGGHGDRNLKPPSVYYEVIDEGAAHVAITSPHEGDFDVSGVREYRRAELDEALSLIGDNRVVLVLGHPGWRPVAREFDLWLETIKMKLSLSGGRVKDLTNAEGKIDYISKELRGFKGTVVMTPQDLAASLEGLHADAKALVMAETGLAPHSTAAEGIARILSEAGLGGELPVLAIDHKALNWRQAGQIIFGEKGLENNDPEEVKKIVSHISERYPMLPGTISDLADEIGDMASLSNVRNSFARYTGAGRASAGPRHGGAKIQPQSMPTPNGFWGGYMDRMLALSKTHALTVGQCASPFFTMTLSLRA